MKRNLILVFIISFNLATTQNINHNKWTQFLQTYVNENGNVDYKTIQANPNLLNTYIEELISQPPKSSWNKNEKLAYWINAYNALTIDLIIKNYPLKSIKDIDKPWDQRLWRFGNEQLSLNEIEHDILRKLDEPRIHFAIVCASESCPKLQNRAFMAASLEKQLTKVTREFLADTTKNKISENNLKLSKIFKCFAKDFKTSSSIIGFLNQYSDVEISSNAKKSFLIYDWTLNK